MVERSLGGVPWLHLEGTEFFLGNFFSVTDQYYTFHFY